MSIFSRIGKAFKKVGKSLGKVPVIGAGLKASFSLTTAPLKVATNVASGQRIDKVAFGSLKESLGDVKAIAPYAQTCLSLVPGVGQGMAGAIGAGLALASGQPITEALAAGLQASLPGGPMAQAAFSLGSSALQGKSLSNAALAALPIGKAEKDALKRGLSVVKAIAHGKRVDTAILTEARKLLPKEAQTALQLGIALAHGKSLQKIGVGILANNIPIKGVDMSLLGKVASFAPKLKSIDAVRAAANIAKAAASGSPQARALIAATARVAKTDSSVKTGFELLKQAQQRQLLTDLASKDPQKRAAAKGAVKTLEQKGDHGRLTELARHAAALRAARKHTVTKTGYVRRT